MQNIFNTRKNKISKKYGTNYWIYNIIFDWCKTESMDKW